MTPIDALATLAALVIVPALVWGLGRTGWTGDRKRLAVIAVAVVLGVTQAVLTGVIVLPAEWVTAIGRGLIMLAGVVTLSQAAYTMLRDKLPDTVAARRALVEGEPTEPLPGHTEVW